MLSITVHVPERFDEATFEIFPEYSKTIQLEHSLVSLAKWEAKWHKPFLGKTEKSVEECRDYVRCMTITQHVESTLYQYISNENIQKINEYIEDPMTASWINDKNKSKNGRIVTAELIYYWMIALNIPVEFQKWHLNRLLMLIQICNEENKPQKKRSKKDLYSRNAALNAARRKSHHSKG